MSNQNELDHIINALLSSDDGMSVAHGNYLKGLKESMGPEMALKIYNMSDQISTEIYHEHIAPKMKTADAKQDDIATIEVAGDMYLHHELDIFQKYGRFLLCLPDQIEQAKAEELFQESVRLGKWIQEQEGEFIFVNAVNWED